MRLRLVLVASILLVYATMAHARANFLPIAGSVGNFRTDVRIVNPSPSKEIKVSAYFVPAGNVNNGAVFSVPPAVITIPKRSTAVLNDVVATLFSKTGLGAIYLTSDDPYLASARIYAQTATGTLGQGYAAADLGDDLMTNGIVQQLRSDASFRTNIGIVNLQNTPLNVTFTLYDRNSNAVSTKTMALESYAIIPPTNLTALFPDAGNADLSDAWVSFSSDVRVGVYASVIDNITTDPTYFAARHDPLLPLGFN